MALQHLGAWISHAHGICNMLVCGWLGLVYGLFEGWLKVSLGYGSKVRAV